jgi:hypothetical protein
VQDYKEQKMSKMIKEVIIQHIRLSTHQNIRNGDFGAESLSCSKFTERYRFRDASDRDFEYLTHGPRFSKDSVIRSFVHSFIRSFVHIALDMSDQ